MMEPARLSKSSGGRKTRIREKIITTAVLLFQEVGFSHVSIARIAEQAGVSQVTVFNHFGNKYNLIEA
ncbi:MAG: helix-turn-helix transcriptional regulator, partial [Spirochaetales bacterium]|nr:helix-turn-helix transcriptional regulator [Spirochaetales bacterium]